MQKLKKTLKNESYLRSFLSIFLLLLSLSLIIVGTVARFRQTKESEIALNYIPAEEIYLVSNTIDENGYYDPLGAWTDVNSTGYQLSFLLTNGRAPIFYPINTQKVNLRIVVQGVFEEENDLSVTLNTRYADDTVNGTYTATRTKITEDSVLYSTYGDGYVFVFAGDGEEIAWSLEGKKFSYYDMLLTINCTNGMITDASNIILLAENANSNAPVIPETTTVTEGEGEETTTEFVEQMPEEIESVPEEAPQITEEVSEALPEEIEQID